MCSTERNFPKDIWAVRPGLQKKEVGKLTFNAPPGGPLDSTFFPRTVQIVLVQMFASFSLFDLFTSLVPNLPSKSIDLSFKKVEVFISARNNKVVVIGHVCNFSPTPNCNLKGLNPPVKRQRKTKGLLNKQNYLTSLGVWI